MKRSHSDDGQDSLEKKSKLDELLWLRCALQPYDWGKKGTSSPAAVLWAAGIEQSGGNEENKNLIDENKPYAELWMGTHPSGPSYVVQEKKTTLLHSYIGTNLPFIFKVLSINKALSIQAHPDKKLAEKLHVSRPDLYKDDNHKPEMACAVSTFEAMCGFRPASEIADFLNKYPEFRVVVTEEVAKEFTDVVRSSETKEGDLKNILRKLFTKLMTCQQDIITQQLKLLLTRIQGKQSSEKNETKKISTSSTTDFTLTEDMNIDVEDLILRLYKQYENDVGVFCPFVLNTFVCSPGQAVFLAPNEPHAYLSGDIVEVMAGSDNVVRAGLTPKPRDTDTLCSMLTYNTGRPTILLGTSLDEYTRSYQIDNPLTIKEFSLTRTHLPLKDQIYTLKYVSNYALLLVYQGSAIITLSSNSKSKISVKKGATLLIPEKSDIIIQATENDVVLFRCYSRDLKSSL